MESTRPIRALLRGLDALTVLNLRGNATVSEVSQEISLPRTTVYRLLETLCSAGFVFRDTADDRYRLTQMVRGLSDGFEDEAWVTQIAKPFIVDLCGEIVWPVSIATQSGTCMMIRESTDHASPLAVQRYSAGCAASMLSTSSGRVYLSHMTPSQRDALIARLAPSHPRDDQTAYARTDLLSALAQIKAHGYCTTMQEHRSAQHISLSVPITLEDRVLAALTVRFAAAVVPEQVGIERFLPKLRQCAVRISTLVSAQQTQVHVNSASDIELSGEVASTP
jgi:IclR family transcriptional regulator, mhp operon transcriptional activator